ncbi:MAG: hypothetical protein MJZ98_02125 [Paludibacteraceae bacterium]|nr:hypothetical protein [Paludibacteraceae bacterium]
MSNFTTNNSTKKSVQRRRIMKPMDVGSNAESQYKTYSDKRKEHDAAMKLLMRLKEKEAEKQRQAKEGKLVVECTDLCKGKKVVYKSAV